MESQLPLFLYSTWVKALGKVRPGLDGRKWSCDSQGCAHLWRFPCKQSILSLLWLNSGIYIIHLNESLFCNPWELLDIHSEYYWSLSLGGGDESSVTVGLAADSNLSHTLLLETGICHGEWPSFSLTSVFYTHVKPNTTEDRTKGLNFNAVKHLLNATLALHCDTFDEFTFNQNMP